MRAAERSKRLLREPLVHFLALGALLFALFRWRGQAAEAAGASGGRIVVTQARIANLASGFERTWQRPPTEEELAALVDDFVREEVYYREALALGLDRDDTIVRRRLRQKLEFVAEGVADALQPTEEELESWLSAHADAFATEPRTTFEHVFLSRERRGDALEADARALLARLTAEGDALDASALGDPLLLPARLERASPSEIDARFGFGFAAKVASLEDGVWGGPLESAYGLHLVRVAEREPARSPALDEVRAEVEREWILARRRELHEAYWAELMRRYEVEIEPSGAPTGVAPAAEEAPRR